MIMHRDMKKANCKSQAFLEWPINKCRAEHFEALDVDDVDSAGYQ